MVQDKRLAEALSVRRCFACSSDKPCSHREPELLPPHFRRVLAAIAAEESTAISTSEVEAILALTNEIQRKPLGRVENYRIKAVDAI